MLENREKHGQAIDVLVELASGHDPADDAERAARAAILDWLPAARAPFDRDDFEPGHVTGSGFVVSHSGQTALIFHKLGRWVQPGGHAEAGERDARAVAARESGEELGLTIDAAETALFDLDVHDIPARGEEPRHLHFDFRFIAAVPPVELRPGSDARDARWFNLGELADLQLDPGLRRMIAKAAARGLLR